MDKPTKAIEESKYGECITVDEYNGKFSLQVSRKGSDGQVYVSWCYPQRNREPMEKAIPMSITIGYSTEEAIANLEWAIKQLSDGDIPF